MLQFRGSVVTSDASLLAYRELEGALRLTVMAGEMLADARTGNNDGSRIARLAQKARYCAILANGLEKNRCSPTQFMAPPRRAHQSFARRL
jgi:hypothetical protein